MLTCRSVDRIFLQAYVPRLQTMSRIQETRFNCLTGNRG